MSNKIGLTSIFMCFKKIIIVIKKKIHHIFDINGILLTTFFFL